jgi:hypothetical protein
MMSLSALLDKFALLEKPLVVSALGAPSAPIIPTPFRPRAGAEAEDPYEPGHWRQPWSEAAQADWLAQAVAVCCSKPYVHSVCWHELADAPAGAPVSEMPHAGLLNANGTHKPSLVRLAQVRNAIRDGKSPLSLHAAGPAR